MTEKLSEQVHHNEDGFTFLELLLVLSIVMIMSVIILPIGEKWLIKKEEEAAIQSIILTIHSLQSYAMANGVTTELNFPKESYGTLYKAHAGSGKNRIEISSNLLPDGMSLGSSSNLKQVRFHPNGDIRESGKLIMVGKSGHTHLTFQFQRGRMIISEPVRFFVARNNSNLIRSHGDFWYTSSIRNKYDKSITQQKVVNASC